MRDTIAGLVAYNRPLATEPRRDPALIRLKLDKLSASPLGWLRGTFHQFCADWPTMGDEPSGLPPQPIVGDLHIENFGAWEDHNGEIAFGVNDFDETGLGAPDFDLARLATSIVLADDAPARHAVSRVEALVLGWYEALRGPPPTLPKLLRELLVAEAERTSRSAWLKRRVDGGEGERRFVASDRYQPVNGPLREAVASAVAAFAGRCSDRPVDCGAWPEVLDVATRIAGTGSLGRLRFAVLLPGKGRRLGHELVLELKEARTGGLDPVPATQQATRVVAHQRLLQGRAPPYLGTTDIDGRPFVVHELQPTEAKVQVAKLSTAALDDVCRPLGLALAALHVRGGAQAPDLPRERAVVRRVTAFALRYAEVCVDDQQALVRRRADVNAQLGLIS